MTRLLPLAILFVALAAQPLIEEASLGDGSATAVSLPVLAAVAAVFAVGPCEALVWAALAGLVSDALHAPPFGADMLCLPLVIFAVRGMLGNRPPVTLASVSVVAGAATFCALLASAATRSLMTRVPLDGGPLFALALRTAVGNAIVAVIVLAIGRFVARALRRVSPEKPAWRQATR